MKISEAGEGIFIYIRGHEDAASASSTRLGPTRLQDKGLDTVRGQCLARVSRRMNAIIIARSRFYAITASAGCASSPTTRHKIHALEKGGIDGGGKHIPVMGGKQSA